MPAFETRIVPSVTRADRTPRQIANEFRALLADGARLLPSGEAKDDPNVLLRRGYGPRYRLDLFDTHFYLTPPRQNPAIRFFVAYVVTGNGRRAQVHPRIFYKDVSLVWRAASHMISTDQEFWIGKGDVRTLRIGGEVLTFSDECTTDLPLELQAELEAINKESSRSAAGVPTDELALYLVLRQAPDGRIRPYNDFSGPRRRAAERGDRINGGRRVARFVRRNDPSSLKFAPGFEPDFLGGIIEESHSHSKLYGGDLHRYRILSRNRRIQYLFFAGPRHVWIVPPQATTTELSSFGVRTIDVLADEDLFVPGYEYHYYDDDTDPPELMSQIPSGFAGPSNPQDPDRADASPWLDKLPVIREFRRLRSRLRVQQL